VRILRGSGRKFGAGVAAFIGVVVLGAIVTPMLANAEANNITTEVDDPAGPVLLSPSAGPAGSSFLASFPCTGLASIAVTSLDVPPHLLWADENPASTGTARFTVNVAADQPPGQLRVVGVCASHGSGYDGYNGCDGYEGYSGYEGYNGDDGYNCAVRTYGPAFFTVTPPPTTTTAPETTTTTTTTTPGVPTLSIDDVSVTETDKKPVKARFTVSLSAPATERVEFTFATSDFTATDGKPKSEAADYSEKSGSLRIAPGATTKTIEITVAGDTIDEADEEFIVMLSNAKNALLTDPTGIGTILDND
jgi:hypothetical protein